MPSRRGDEVLVRRALVAELVAGARRGPDAAAAVDDEGLVSRARLA
jgi:hypothetical protein